MKIKKRGSAVVTLLICLLFILVITMAVWMVLDKTNIIQNSTNSGSNNGSISNENNQNVENSNTNIASNNELEAINDTLCIATNDLGEIYIERNGNNVYYEPESNMTLNVVSTNYIHNTTYNPDPSNTMTDLTFTGYKLDLENVQAAYAVRFGNGGYDYSIIFVHKDGSISEMNFKDSYSSDKINITLTKNIQSISNIVSVVQERSFGGSSAVLIDKDGNWYSYYGINN